MSRLFLLPLGPSVTYCSGFLSQTIQAGLSVEGRAAETYINVGHVFTARTTTGMDAARNGYHRNDTTTAHQRQMVRLQVYYVQEQMTSLAVKFHSQELVR